jgi:hypothetical protein
MTTETPAWVTDETVAPPYPLLRCPTCKRVFSNHGIHVCSKEFLHPSFRDGETTQGNS